MTNATEYRTRSVPRPSAVSLRSAVRGMATAASFAKACFQELPSDEANRRFAKGQRPTLQLVSEKVERRRSVGDSDLGGIARRDGPLDDDGRRVTFMPARLGYRTSRTMPRAFLKYALPFFMTIEWASEAMFAPRRTSEAPSAKDSAS